jgi:hypothetical protein
MKNARSGFFSIAVVTLGFLIWANISTPQNQKNTKTK